MTYIENRAVTPQAIDGDVFGGDNPSGTDKSTCMLYVPKESVDLYNAADVWKDFQILPTKESEVTPMYGTYDFDNMSITMNDINVVNGYVAMSSNGRKYDINANAKQTMSFTITQLPTISFSYSNDSIDERAAFKITKSGEYMHNYIQADAKNCTMTIRGLQTGDSIILTLGSKGETPNSFGGGLEGCTLLSGNITQPAKSGNIVYESLTFLATAHTAIITCTAGGYALRKILLKQGTMNPNPDYTPASGKFSIDGIWYNLDGNNLTAEVTFQGSDYTSATYSGALNIPAIVTYDNIEYAVISIGDCAFDHCTGLTSVTIPNSVTSIEWSAFNGCTGLTSLTIPNSVTSIGSSAFRNVPNIVYSGSATGSPWGAKSVNGYVDGYLVYSDNTKTTLIACSSSAQGEINIPNSVTSIGEQVFYYCNSLTSVTMPNSVTSVGDGAFYSCHSLTSLTIGRNVTSIGNYAFYDCTGLTTIEWNAKNCNRGYFGSQVESFSFGDSVKVIPSGLCQGMYKLTSITIPNSVTTIEEHAFAHCQELTSIENYSPIPQTIQNNVFENVDTSTCTLYVPLESIDLYRAANVWKSFTHIRAIDNACIHSSGICGAQDNNLTWQLSCDGILTISGTGAMADFSDSNVPWLDYRNSIESVVIEEGVSNIGAYAFHDCSQLTSITIPSSITSMGASAFSGCSNLSVHISDIAAWCSIAFANEGGFAAYHPLNLAAHFYLNDTEITDLVIPESVTRIEARAFAGFKGMTSVSIPNSVTSIGNGAFRGCTGLTSVTIPNSITTLSTAFYACSGLTSITIPNSVTFIDWYALEGCSSLTSVEIPNSVTTIGTRAFGSCYGLTSITIPSSVTQIYDPFHNCTGLTSMIVDEENSRYDSRDNCNAIIETASNTLIAGCKNTIIPSSVTSIGTCAFIGNSALTSISIPNTITTIGSHAFRNCTGLTSITIPNSVTSIGEMTFDGCSSLIFVMNYATTPQTINSNVFNGVNKSTCKLYVPQESIDLYRTADGWKEFNNILSIEDFFNPEDPQNPGSYRLTLIAEPANMGIVAGDGLYEQGAEVEFSAIPNTGHHFVNWSDGNTSATRSLTILRDTTFTANFAINYYDITFEDYNGMILQRTQEAYGTLPLYNDNIPIRQDSALYTFTFKGWSPVIDTVREAAVYTAVYDSIYQGLDSVVVTNNKDIAELSVGTLTHLIVEQKGHLIVSEPRNIYSLTLHMDSTSAQVTNIANLTAENVEMVLHMPKNTDSVQWYAFAVPFEVAIASGIRKDGANEPATSGIHFVIDRYDGGLRASTQNGWQRLAVTDTLFPGNLYMIAAYETPEAWRFTAVHPEILAEQNSINVSAYTSSAGDHHAGWNAISNTLWTNASASMNGVDYITTYNNQYGVYEVELIAGHDFLPAEPFFVQTPANGSILFSHSSAPAHITPLQMALTSAETAVYTLGLTAVKSGYTDKAYITLNESKEDAYIIGRDLEKMQHSSSSVPQLWIEAYNLHLAAQEVAFTDSMASVALGLYVPVAGTYMLNIQDVPENTNVYLTLDGNVPSKLSLNTVELNLAKGENNRYGLYICNMSNTPEGFNDISSEDLAPRKVIIDGNVYILRGEKVYTLDGRLVR